MKKKEKLIIIFLILALVLVLTSITLLNSPKPIKESCIKAGFRWDSTKNQCIKERRPIYCSNISITKCKGIYQPVCGWFDTTKVRCIKYPCAQTFGNNCFACSNKNVLYYTEGTCPA